MSGNKHLRIQVNIEGEFIGFFIAPKSAIDRFDHNTLKQHLRRAEKLGLPATLTMEQWQATVRYFDGKCAYCQENPFQVLEHFIPLGLGGGTTAENCVPACRSCNVTKREWHPLHLPLDFFPMSKNLRRIHNAVPSIQQYLTTCGSEDTAAS